jgi:hypothetical protein
VVPLSPPVRRPGLYLDGQAGVIHELLAGFPAEQLVADAELAAVAAGDELASGSLEAAERYPGLAVLQLELRRTEPDQVAGLHRAAATWFAGHGCPVEAIRHAQAAQDWDLDRRLLADRWPGPPAVPSSASVGRRGACRGSRHRAHACGAPCS